MIVFLSVYFDFQYNYKRITMCNNNNTNMNNNRVTLMKHCFNYIPTNCGIIYVYFNDIFSTSRGFSTTRNGKIVENFS